jgi:hypothetical protein
VTEEPQTEEPQTGEQPTDEPQAEQQTSAAPRPAPRPGPARPVPGPIPRPHPPTQPVITTPHCDPHKFGRVDADGTVWLISSAGERIIGSWQAGEPEAAFAHFGRRFDDLATEISLMEARLSSGTGDARKIKAAAATLAQSLPTASVLGDIDALAERLNAIRDHADANAHAERERREEHRAAQIARKEALAAEAEELASKSTQWKVAGDRMRAIVDEWRSITGVDRKTDDALWRRYSAARETFNRRRGSHFAELDRDRATAREAKEKICKRAEELSSSTDWAATGAAFRELLAEWKSSGRASRELDDALWNRFKAAQDKFFAARNADNAQRDVEYQSNAAAKEQLLAEAEKIDTAQSGAARAALRALTDKWDAIGKVPRDRVAEFERRLRAVETRLRDATETVRTVDPEAGPARHSSVRVPNISNNKRVRRLRPAAPRTPMWRGPMLSSGSNGPTPPRRQ